MRKELSYLLANHGLNDFGWYARIRSIEFFNFRNIEHSKIELPNAKVSEYSENQDPSILGLYGQNGSGKTSVVMSIELLKALLSGESIDSQFDSCIKEGCDHCRLIYEISLKNNQYKTEEPDILESILGYEIYYEVNIKHNYIDENKYLNVFNEKLSIKPIGEGLLNTKHPKTCYIDTSSKEHPFGNKDRYNLFFGKNKDAITNLNEEKIKCSILSKSFIFSKKLFEFINATVNEIDLKDYDSAVKRATRIAIKMANLDNEQVHNKHLSFTEALKVYSFETDFNECNQIVKSTHYKLYLWNVLKNLSYFGRHYLQIINTSTTGITNVNQVLPLLLWFRNDAMYYKKVDLNMNGSSIVPLREYETVATGIEGVNVVLKKIIPGLSLEIKDLGKLINNNNEEFHEFEVLSRRSDTVIPLRFESDGVRRIISILSMLVAAFNSETFTIVIDEIDSGIYEYLLGELLEIISNRSKGQLLFTSHNLRPLEKISPQFLCFTTVNPNNRFIKLQKRGNSNFRDTYIRNIVLGNDKESVYSPTDKYDIEMAFYEAGVLQGLVNE